MSNGIGLDPGKLTSVTVTITSPTTARKIALFSDQNLTASVTNPFTLTALAKVWVGEDVPGAQISMVSGGIERATADAVPLSYNFSAGEISTVKAYDGPVTDTIANGTYSPIGAAAQTLIAALPNTVKATRTYDDGATTTVRIVSCGSSVGLGPTGGADTVNTIPNYLFAALSPVINRLGNMTLTNTNASVGGSTITSGQQTDYALAKTAAGGTPTLLALIYGMNDGTSAQYHANQTYPGVYNNGKILIQQAQADGADVVIFTTPHPHSGRQSWAWGGGISYPTGGVAIPALTSGASIKTVTLRNGATVATASYRHLRVNQALRQLGADMGVPVIDVEPYWFEAVAANGEDALFNVPGDTVETVHPNLLGFQLSYFKAIDAFVRGLTQPSVVSGIVPRISQSGYFCRSVIAGSTVGGNTAAGGGVNTADATAFYVDSYTTVDRVAFFVGASAGNVDVGIFDANGAGNGPGALLTHSGSVACPAAGGRAIAVPAVTLAPGKYFAALVSNNATATFRWRDSAQSLTALGGIRYLLAGFPLAAGSWGVNTTGQLVELVAGKS